MNFVLFCPEGPKDSPIGIPSELSRIHIGKTVYPEFIEGLPGYDGLSGVLYGTFI
jgi:hypothetical protein